MTRVLRTVGGVGLLLVSLSLLLVGAVLWTVLGHRGADGGFAATIEPISATSGYAVVVPDVDELLSREASFVRGGDTGLRVTARTPRGPVFVGLAPADAVAGYLADVPHTQVTSVKLTRGALPVRATPVAGKVAPPTRPALRPFWVAKSTATGTPDTVDWVPTALRGQHYALVIMNPDASRPVQVELTASATVGWLPSTAAGVLVLGAVLLLLGLVVLCWPTRSREIVYVVEPGQLPDVAARLGGPPARATPAVPSAWAVAPSARAVESVPTRFAIPPVPTAAPVAGLANGVWPLPPPSMPRPSMAPQSMVAPSRPPQSAPPGSVPEQPVVARPLPPRPPVTLELDWPPR